jgi:pilus assembly protein CpaC
MKNKTRMRDRRAQPEAFRGLAATALALTLVGAGVARAADPAPVLSADGPSLTLEEPASEADILRTLEMERGKSRFVRTAYPVKRVSVGDPDILEVVVINTREFQLVAKNVGATNVLVWDQAGRPKAAIDVSVGTAYVHLERELQRILGNDKIQVESAGQGVVLKGNAPDALAAEHAITVARSFLGNGEGAAQVVNLLEIGGNQQVMLKVVLAEMAREIGREFGTNWNALIQWGNNSVNVSNFIDGLTSLDDNGDILLSDAINLAAQITGFGSLSFLQIFLDVLDERGLAKILAEPTLVARSGESATFLVGGEVAIPVSQGGASFGSITIEFKSFGVGVQFTPTVLEDDRIHLEVAPEVSNVDFTLGTTFQGATIPGFVTRRAGTAVELADGQSFAIAGLLREELRERQAGYPLLGRVPLIGNAFRASTFDKRETELVIIVTPYLVNPLGPGPHPLPTDRFIEPNAAEFYLLGALEGHPSRMNTQYGGMIGDVGHRVQAAPEGGDQ